jgi:hypothetical protein
VELDSRIEHVRVLYQHQLTVEQTVLAAARKRKRATISNVQVLIVKYDRSIILFQKVGTLEFLDLTGQSNRSINFFPVLQ